MIEDAPVLTIKKKFGRPTKRQIASFHNAQTGHIADAMGGLGAMDGKIKSVTDNSSICGVALTCQCGPADNLAAIAAIEMSMPGDVIIASTDNFESTAVMGDIMLGIAKNRGVKGFVTDGFVRDLVGINKVGIPCFSKGVIPNSPAKSGPGKVGTSIVIGGIYVNSGDIIVADLDGIVVVPNLLIAEVALNLKKVLRVEKEIEDKVKLGIKELGLIKTIFDSGKIKEID